MPRRYFFLSIYLEKSFGNYSNSVRFLVKSDWSVFFDECVGG